VSRALKGDVIRGFSDHRTRIGRQYTRLIREKQDEIGTVPKGSRHVLREWARVILQLNEIAADLEKPSTKKQAMACRRLKRDQKVLRFTMMRLEEHLERLGDGNNDLARALMAQGASR